MTPTRFSRVYFLLPLTAEAASSSTQLCKVEGVKNQRSELPLNQLSGKTAFRGRSAQLDSSSFFDQEGQSKARQGKSEE
jgi:hypothetical protein